MTQPETLFILGGFLVRLGIPLAIIALVTWLLHRLDAHWHAQSSEVSLASGTGERTTTTSPLLAAQHRPCWEVKGCSDAMRATCEAHAQPSIACWLLHLRRDGRLPAKCRCCEVFGATSVMSPAGAD